MTYNVSYEVVCPNQDPVSDVMLVEADSEDLAIEMAQHVLEEQYPGEDDCVLLECQVK